MLVLTRKSNESIKLGDDITVTIIEVKGNAVRLGIDAPADVRVFRKELYDRIREENFRSSSLFMDEFTKIRNALRPK